VLLIAVIFIRVFVNNYSFEMLLRLELIVYLRFPVRGSAASSDVSTTRFPLLYA
jgi:hypothetical protein